MEKKLELVEILRHYDLRVGSIESYSLFHLLKTNRGPKILKVWDNIDKLSDTFHFKELLAKSGFRKIDRFIRTKDHSPYVVTNNIGYSLSDVIDGMSPSLERKIDMEIIGKTLAEFHLAMSKVKPDKPFVPWSTHFERGLKQFKTIETNLMAKKNKSTFDKILLEDMEKHQVQIKHSIQIAKNAEEKTIKNRIEPIWCHGNMSNQSFKIDEYGEGWITDFNVPVVDFPSYDLAKLASRIYMKSNYNIELVKAIIDHYQEKIPLVLEDKLWILTYLAFPHDLWKFIYMNYIAKTLRLEQIHDKYKVITEQQVHVGKLYQDLFNYFDL